jgi:CBS domain containing-hemolysin-like protein
VRVAARLPVSDLGELFGAELEPELAEADVDTVGGLLAQRLGRVPLPGAQAEVAGLRLLAEGGKDARGRIRITTVLVSPVDEPPAEEHPAGTGRTTSGSMNRAAERREGSDVAS